MDPKPVVSVIVPVYNCAATLAQCVESVLMQRYPAIELVLVDDGSTDEGGALCKRYAAAHSEIKALHQPNAGLAAARNAGLQAAAGEYVLFLDADDYYEGPALVGGLVAAARAEQADVVCFGYRRYIQKKAGWQGKTSPLQAAYVPRGGNLLREMAQQNTYQSSACVKLIRRALLTQNGICFEPDRLSEDVLFSARLYAAAEKLAYRGDVAYIYRVRPGSITQSITQRHVLDLLHAVEACVKLFAALPEGDKKYGGECYTAFQYCTLLINSQLCPEPLPKEVCEKIHAMRPLLQHDGARQVRLVRRACQLAGFSGAQRLLTLYFKWFRY